MILFPDPKRQGEIKFFVAKGLSYKPRMLFIVGFLSVGLLIQLFVNFWIGLLFLAAATVLSLVKGYDSTPKLKGGESWNRVTPDEFEKVLRKQKELKRWDADFFDVTNPLGAGLAGALAVGMMITFVFFETSQYAGLFKYLVGDIVILFAPHFVTGVKSYLKRDELVIKIKLFQKILRKLSAGSEVQVQPMLATQEVRKGGRVPKDARLLIRLLNAPEEFLGVQVQISINSVQGTDYPYLYCVILARDKAKLFTSKDAYAGKLSRNIITKLTKSDDVDVLVVRQKTSRNSGYHTNASKARQIVSQSIDLARDLLKNL